MATRPPTTLDGHLELRIRDLELEFSIGVREHEKRRRQRVVINLWLYVADSGPHRSDDLRDYVSYSDVVHAIEKLAAAERHINLVETLAEEVAQMALADSRVVRVVVSIEKPDIIPAAAGVGVRIERMRGLAAI